MFEAVVVGEEVVGSSERAVRGECTVLRRIRLPNFFIWVGAPFSGDDFFFGAYVDIPPGDRLSGWGEGQVLG